MVEVDSKDSRQGIYPGEEPMESVTEKVAEFVSGFEGENLPPEAIHKSKRAVLDCLGVALAGCQEPVSQILRESVTETHSKGEASIWGTKDKVCSMDAALVNGAMSHALDYDDINRHCLGHPSAILVPTVFAVAERIRSSGRKLLEGYIVGLEVMAKLGEIFTVEAYEKSWHPTSVVGVMGASASASYLLRLSAEQTANALGIAASEASGIKKNFGTMVKPFHAGSAARKGIWAALLARNGLVANAQALDGKFGFFEMFKGSGPYDLKPLEGLGRSLEITSAGLVVKQYPCCGGLHSALDALMEIRQKGNIRPEEVEEVECKVDPRRIAYLNRPEIRSGLEAKFSYQYCMATGLLEGRIGLSHFPEEVVVRPEVRSLMGRVRLIPGEGFGFASEVTIRTSDKKVFSKTMPEAKGSPTFPLTEAEVLQKFLDCTSHLLNKDQAKRAAETIMNLEQETSPGRILELLQREP